MKKLMIFLTAALISFCLRGGKPASFPGHINPTQIVVTGDHLYIVELPTVSIYSLKDFKLKKKFGKKGEGPKEFKVFNNYSVGFDIDVQAERLLVNSVGKLSIFSKNGEYTREINVASANSFRFFGDKFIGFQNVTEGKTSFSTLNIFNSKIEIEKEMIKRESWMQAGYGWKFLSTPFPGVIATGDKIFFCGSYSDFKIDVFDHKGKKLSPISIKYKRVKFKKKDQEIVLQRYYDDPISRPRYEVWKRILKFPRYFPAIRDIFADNKQLYVRTYRKKDKKTEFYVFSTGGQSIKTIFLPIRPSNSKYDFPYLRDSAPFTIKDGILYQLIDNPKTEVFELHAEKIN